MGVLLLLFLAVIVNGVTYSVSYQKEFIVNFLEGTSIQSRPIPRIHIVNPTDNVAQINITTPLLTWGPAAIDESDVVPAKSFIVKEFHADIISSGTNVENKTVLIVADVDVIVYGFEVQKWGSDSFAVPSVKQLGKEFVAVTHGDLPGGPLSIALSSACDGNMVNISLSGRKPISTAFNATVYTNGDIISIALDQYQSVQILFDITDGGDFSGTYITSNSPIFVQAGAVKTAIGTTSYQDYITESLPPVSTLGTIYYVVPFKRGSGGDVIRIIAVNDPTLVLVTNQNGQAVHYDLLPPFSHVDINTMNSKDYFHIEASNKILVAQFLKSNRASSTHEADPAVAILNDVISWTNTYHFSTMKYYSTWNMDSHYVNIAISRLAVDGLRLNGAVLGVNFTDIGSSGFAGAQLQITTGFHALTHEHGVPFSAIYYAYAYLSAAAVNLHIPSASPSQCPKPTVDIPTTQSETTQSETTQPETTQPETTHPETTQPETTSVVETTTEPETTTVVEMTTQQETTLEGEKTSQHATSDIMTTPMMSLGPSASTIGTKDLPTSTQGMASTEISATHTSHVTKMTTESVIPATAMDTWMYWSECSVTCGTGTQYRIMTSDKYLMSHIVPGRTSANSSVPGGSGNTQSRQCNLEVCQDPDWFPWQPWTQCSSFCDKGTRRRNRDCRNPGMACSAGNKAHELCSMTHCDALEEARGNGQVAVKQKFFSWPVLTEADRRPVSCTIGGGMIFFLVLVAALIILLDVGTLHNHFVKYNRFLNTKPKAEKTGPSDPQDSKGEIINLNDL